MIDRLHFNRPFGFSTLFVVFSAALMLNFFLTANPYGAGHSGQAGNWTNAYSDTWVLHLGLLIIFAILSTFIARPPRLSYRVLSLIGVLTLLLVASGIGSSVIWSFYNTYAFIIFSFVGVGLISFTDVNISRKFDGKSFCYLIMAGYLLAILLAIIRPGVWGWMPFEFSRTSRGELTLASNLALPLLVSSSFVAFKQSRTLLISLIIAVVLVLEFSCVTRTTMWKIVTPFFIGAIFFFIRKYFLFRKLKKISVLLIAATVLLVVIGVSFSIYKILGQVQLELFLNSRLHLWQWHWDLFRQHPLWGVGVFPEQRFIEYRGTATSEIGVLAAFSQFGIGFGLFQVFLIIRAIIHSVFILMYKIDKEFVSFGSCIVLTMFPIWLFGGSWRIINATDLWFWYFIFYINFHRSYHFSAKPLHLNH